MDEGRSEAQKKNNPDYPYNLNLDLIVGLPDFAFLDDPYIRTNDDLLRVRVHSKEVRYGTEDETSPLTSFFAQSDVLANYKCRKDVEIFPGIFTLRQPTQLEIETTGKRPLYSTKSEGPMGSYPFPPVCDKYNERFKDDPNAGFKISAVVYDSGERPVGEGHCMLKKSVDRVITNSENCGFRFWLEQNREVTLRFHGKHLANIAEYYQKTAELLTQATVVEKSRNMAR
jgi:hypothetical protein